MLKITFLQRAGGDRCECCSWSATLFPWKCFPSTLERPRSVSRPAKLLHCFMFVFLSLCCDYFENLMALSRLFLNLLWIWIMCHCTPTQKKLVLVVKNIVIIFQYNLMFIYTFFLCIVTLLNIDTCLSLCMLYVRVITYAHRNGLKEPFSLLKSKSGDFWWKQQLVV